MMKSAHWRSTLVCEDAWVSDSEDALKELLDKQKGYLNLYTDRSRINTYLKQKWLYFSKLKKAMLILYTTL